MSKTKMDYHQDQKNIAELTLEMALPAELKVRLLMEYGTQVVDQFGAYGKSAREYVLWLKEQAAKLTEESEDE